MQSIVGACHVCRPTVFAKAFNPENLLHDSRKFVSRNNLKFYGITGSQWMCSSSWSQHQQKMQEASVMASNRNQLASYTVDVLELITRELQAPFVIPSMVDRISAMLNYVLKQLVGPKRRQLNVSLLAGH